jgi:hypothetical protein
MRRITGSEERDEYLAAWRFDRAMAGVPTATYRSEPSAAGMLFAKALYQALDGASAERFLLELEDARNEGLAP